MDSCDNIPMENSHYLGSSRPSIHESANMNASYNTQNMDFSNQTMAATPNYRQRNSSQQKKNKKQKQVSIDYTSLKTIHPDLDCYTIEESTPQNINRQQQQQQEQEINITPFDIQQQQEQSQKVNKNQVIIEDETFPKLDNTNSNKNPDIFLHPPMDKSILLNHSHSNSTQASQKLQQSIYNNNKQQQQVVDLRPKTTYTSYKAPATTISSTSYTSYIITDYIAVEPGYTYDIITDYYIPVQPGTITTIYDVYYPVNNNTTTTYIYN